MECRIEDILKITTPEEFDRAAMEVFRWQASLCAPYREYLETVGIAPESIQGVKEIPFLPIEIFKTHRVYCDGGRGEEPEAVFTSSSTGGEGTSKHYVASLADYERVYTRGFELFYGSPCEVSIYALLPSYLEREGSSLVRMVDGLIRRGHENGRGGGFYLYDHEKLLHDMAADGSKKILLGVSYALLDLAEEMAANRHCEGNVPEAIQTFSSTIVMETGGMKGRREEMSKAQMHSILQEAFGVPEIHSEYGMAELMSQAYSRGGGRFETPPWMRVTVRDLSDPFDVRHSGRGGINIVDLANMNSCAFIQTQDIGTVAADGSFTIDGRVARSDIRGCNLLVQ